MRFITKPGVDENLRLSRFGVSVQFTGGTYDTDDVAEIVALERSKRVTSHPAEAAPGVLKGDALDEAVKAAGIEAASTLSADEKRAALADLDEDPDADGPAAE